MNRPSPAFLSVCIANALLENYGVGRPPVPVRIFLRSPPQDLARDLSLTEMLPYGEAIWLRLMGGQGTVFANPAVPEARRRYAMARALFTGLCSSEMGKTAGLPPVSDEDHRARADLFARSLLMPSYLLPAQWEAMSPDELASLFSVPQNVAETRLQECASAS